MPKSSRAPSAAASVSLWRDGDDGPAGGEDAVHFAGDDDAFEAALDGDDVGVGGGENGRDFGRWKKGRKRTFGAPGGRFETSALRAVTDEDEADAVAFEFARGREQCVPGAVEAEIAGVEQDESEIACESRCITSVSNSGIEAGAALVRVRYHRGQLRRALARRLLR